MPEDIITDVMRQVRLLNPDRPHSELWHLERRLRDMWGGQRVYVLKDPAGGKAGWLAESLAAGRPLREATRYLRVHPSTCYRLLRRRWVASY